MISFKNLTRSKGTVSEDEGYKRNHKVHCKLNVLWRSHANNNLSTHQILLIRAEIPYTTHGYKTPKNADKVYNPKIPLYRAKYGINPHFSHKKGDDNNKNYLIG